MSDHPQGFHCLERQGSGETAAPLVLLHGSGRREDDLLDFAALIAPQRRVLALRGQVAWEEGFAFFRRRPDRSLDHADLQRATLELAAFLENLAQQQPVPPVLVGYSNGAILAASVAARTPQLISGAILLRPLSPFVDAIETSLSHCPFLLLSGRDDARRQPEDASFLQAQLAAAGAAVTHHRLACGHDWDGEGGDVTLSKRWLETMSAAR